MKSQKYFQILAAALMLRGLVRAEDSAPVSVQVGVSKPVMSITETKMPSGPVTWLGIAAQEAPDNVLAQLPAEQAAGLLVCYVSKGSPADKAGVQVNDVLTRLDNQILVHPDQLKVLVGSRKAGDAVELTGYRHGKEFGLTAKLESKALPTEEAMKLGMPGPMVKEWNSVSSLPPEVQKMIGEALSARGTLGVGPVSVSGSFTVIGPDGKQISSGAISDQGAISQLLKLSTSLSSGTNTTTNADTAVILKLLQQQAAANPASAKTAPGGSPK